MKALVSSLVFALAVMSATPVAAEPVRVAVARLKHDHVFWLLDRPRDRGDIRVVGFYEPNEELAARRANEFNLDPSIFFTDLDRMLAATRPEAVCHFGSVREHRDDALRCFRFGAHVMVEKPLALNHRDAATMAEAARDAGLHLLTNYETTWYSSHAELRQRLDSGELGAIRRLGFRTGHRGPIAIGCRPEFVAWLLDPAASGGGAITDFGCYGANLATWLLGGRAPASVWATLRTIKRDSYANVDDDATITLDYGDAVAVLQPSWNWPIDVKETAVYAERGEAVAAAGDSLRVEVRGQPVQVLEDLPRPNEADADPFAHLAAVVRRGVEPNALSAIENNLVVMRILDAARESARTGRVVKLVD